MVSLQTIHKEMFTAHSALSSQGGMDIALVTDVDTNDCRNLKTCSILLHYAPERVDTAVQLLLSVVGQIEVKAGCRSCWVGRSVAEDSWINYREEWDSEKAFRRHVRSEEFHRVLAAMDLCDEEPRVMIGILKANCGIEFLRKLRSKLRVNPCLKWDSSRLVRSAVPSLSSKQGHQ